MASTSIRIGARLYDPFRAIGWSHYYSATGRRLEAVYGRGGWTGPTALASGVPDEAGSEDLVRVGGGSAWAQSVHGYPALRTTTGSVLSSGIFGTPITYPYTVVGFGNWVPGPVGTAGGGISHGSTLHGFGTYGTFEVVTYGGSGFAAGSQAGGNPFLYVGVCDSPLSTINITEPDWVENGASSSAAGTSALTRVTLGGLFDNTYRQPSSWYFVGIYDGLLTSTEAHQLSRWARSYLYRL